MRPGTAAGISWSIEALHAGGRVPARALPWFRSQQEPGEKAHGAIELDAIFGTGGGKHH
jgi:hypothetical protein